MTDLPLQFFDPKQDHTIVWKNLPHWAQAGTICFITWRTADSMPKEVIENLKQKRRELLKQFHLDPNSEWKQSLAKLPAELRGQLHWSFFAAWDAELDQAAGDCVLRDPALSAIVMDSLRHFDGDRYWLTDVVVMPNHVHLLVAFRDEAALLKQCTSWKRFTAKEVNARLSANALHHPTTGRRLQPPKTGEFWQVDQFDHLVRNEGEFQKYRRYIAGNLTAIGLPATPERYYSRSLGRVE